MTLFQPENAQNLSDSFFLKSVASGKSVIFFGILIVCLQLLNSCGQTKTAAPTISEDEMVRIMADLSLAEAATTHLNGYPRDSLNQVYFKQVFEMHKITMEQYEQNLRMYATDLSTMERIVKNVEAKFEPEKKAAE
ncbi:MAG: DUF4296 domain-containing protein [Bacteroidota bacterium]